MLPDPFFVAALLLFGLLFGSFANVVIWRFPRGMSISRPPSHCPSCEGRIAWYDNIPVVSWIALRAQCRRCGARIPARYPIVELLSGLLWAAAGIRFGQEPRTGVAIALFWTLLVLAFVDWDTMRLPNAIVGGLAALGLLAAMASQISALSLAPLVGPPSSSGGGSPLLWAGVGSVLGGGSSLLIASLYRFARGRSGFGMGDVKLLAAMGLYLGAYSLFALLVGSVVGAVVGIIIAVRTHSDLGTSKIPFGPFLALGGIATVLAGEGMVGAYLRAVGMG